MKTSLFAVAALAALLATPALAQDSNQQWTDNHSAKNTCLQLGQIWSWRAPDNRTLIVENDRHQKFKLDMMGYCPGLQYKETIAIRSPGGSYLSCVTPGDSVFFHDIGMETRCVINKIAPYTKEMEQADKAAKEKKKSE